MDKYAVFLESKTPNEFVQKIWEQNKELNVITLARDWHRFEKKKRELKQTYNLEMFKPHERRAVEDLITYKKLTVRNLTKYVGCYISTINRFMEDNKWLKVPQ